MQTCYDRVEDLGSISEKLFIKYQGAVEVQKSDRDDGLEPVRVSTVLDEEDLTYVGESPTFCTSELSRGILGSRDRLCDPNPQSPNSCGVLCCGRGHYTIEKQVPREICEFVWCCRIDCRDDGFDTVIEHRCN